MKTQARQAPVNQSELVEKLNHLEYVVKTTKRAVTSFKDDQLKDQTEDFIKFMEVVEDAIGAYRDEVADLLDITE
jgi:hypothetical protein